MKFKRPPIPAGKQPNQINQKKKNIEKFDLARRKAYLKSYPRWEKYSDGVYFAQEEAIIEALDVTGFGPSDVLRWREEVEKYEKAKDVASSKMVVSTISLTEKQKNLLNIGDAPFPSFEQSGLVVGDNVNPDEIILSEDFFQTLENVGASKSFIKKLRKRNNKKITKIKSKTINNGAYRTSARFAKREETATPLESIKIVFKILRPFTWYYLFTLGFAIAVVFFATQMISYFLGL